MARPARTRRRDGNRAGTIRPTSAAARGPSLAWADSGNAGPESREASARNGEVQAPGQGRPQWAGSSPPATSSSSRAIAIVLSRAAALSLFAEDATTFSAGARQRTPFFPGNPAPIHPWAAGENKYMPCGFGGLCLEREFRCGSWNSYWSRRSRWHRQLSSPGGLAEAVRAVGLEARLDRALAERKVNLVNQQREFSSGSPGEVRDILAAVAGQHTTTSWKPWSDAPANEVDTTWREPAPR
jgi:hypothetical protein